MQLWPNQERLALCGVGGKLFSEHLEIPLKPFGPQYLIFLLLFYYLPSLVVFVKHQKTQGNGIASTVNAAESAHGLG